MNYPIKEKFKPMTLGYKKQAVIHNGMRVAIHQKERCEEVLSLEKDLRHGLKGQDSVIEIFLNRYEYFLAGMCRPDTTLANFMLLGPTGTGKTLAVELMAQSILGSINAMTKINCAEFQHSPEIAKLIGSPPGYIGHRETSAMLTQVGLDQWQTDAKKISFVLFDEIEKASDALWKILLGIMDKAKLTLGDNTVVDFSRCMIFFTSNIAARQMQSDLEPLGFHKREIVDKLVNICDSAMREKFDPEFIGRIDNVVVFNRLSEDNIASILELELEKFSMQMNSRLILRFTENLKKEILGQGYSSRYGARHLRRTIEKLIGQPLACLLNSGSVQQFDRVEIDWDDKGVGFYEVEPVRANSIVR